MADAIKDQYPALSHVQVDVATIRVTDKERGERYIYLTPASVGEMLLAFDQGWIEDEKLLPKKLLIRKAVKIIPVTKSASMTKKTTEHQAARLAELEAKEQKGGTLTDGEQRALGKLRNRKQATDRPITYGPSKVEVIGKDVVVRGGVPPKHHKHNPNLLHGRTRHFGAKTAQPSEVFKRAVKEAVKVEKAKWKGKKQ